MRTALGVLVLLVLSTGCGTQSAPRPGPNTAAMAEQAGMLAPYWRKHYDDAWINNAMRAVCIDLREHDSRPQEEALRVVEEMKHTSVANAESLVAAGISTNCPGAAKIPKAWH